MTSALAEGVMFDLDGTLILSDRQLGQYRLLPGAVELLEELDRRGLPFVALTNGSAYPAAGQARRWKRKASPPAFPVTRPAKRPTPSTSPGTRTAT